MKTAIERSQKTTKELISLNSIVIKKRRFIETAFFLYNYFKPIDYTDRQSAPLQNLS